MMSYINSFRDTETYETFATGQVIFTQGQAGKFMYIVKEGLVEIQVNDKPVTLLGMGETLGEMSLIEDSPRSATAIAKTKCKLVVINQNYFDFLLQNTPYFGNNMLQIVTTRLRQMNQQV